MGRGPMWTGSPPNCREQWSAACCPSPRARALGMTRAGLPRSVAAPSSARHRATRLHAAPSAL
eukprot:1185902-Pleurochrysis_carterae.AAC.1